MTSVVSILVADANNPVELQTWITANPLVVPLFITVEDHVFYIFY